MFVCPVCPICSCTPRLFGSFGEFCASQYAPLHEYVSYWNIYPQVQRVIKEDFRWKVSALRQDGGLWEDATVTERERTLIAVSGRRRTRIYENQFSILTMETDKCRHSAPPKTDVTIGENENTEPAFLLQLFDVTVYSIYEFTRNYCVSKCAGANPQIGGKDILLTSSATQIPRGRCEKICGHDYRKKCRRIVGSSFFSTNISNNRRTFQTFAFFFQRAW